jgi:hypothetical protein
MKAYHVTTLEFSTNQMTTYQVVAGSVKDAKNKIIAGIENKTKKGDTVYDVLETESLWATEV